MGERVLLRYCIRLGFDLNALQICICLPVRCHAWTCVRRIDWLVGCATIRFATGAFTRLDMYVCQILFAFDLLPVRLRAWICMYVKCCLLLIYYRCGFAPGYVCMSSVVCSCHKTVREQFSEVGKVGEVEGDDGDEDGNGDGEGDGGDRGGGGHPPPLNDG